MSLIQRFHCSRATLFTTHKVHSVHKRQKDTIGTISEKHISAHNTSQHTMRLSTYLTHPRLSTWHVSAHGMSLHTACLSETCQVSVHNMLQHMTCLSNVHDDACLSTQHIIGTHGSAHMAQLTWLRTHHRHTCAACASQHTLLRIQHTCN